MTVQTKKLKPEKAAGALALPALVLAAFITILIFFGQWTAFHIMAAFFFSLAAVSLTAFARTGHRGYLVVMLFQFCVAMLCASVFDGVLFINKQWVQFWLFGLYFFAAWTAYLLLTRNIKWRGREILQMAAKPVDDVTNGFTARPRSAGRIDITPAQLHDFTDYASRNLIAMPYRLTDRTVLVPIATGQSYRHILGIPGELTHQTWISIDGSGNVDVNISREDYLKYEQSLSFDQLCESLGDLFVNFIELFKRGEQSRIIDAMNALKEHPVS